MGKYSNVPMTRRSQSVGGINLARRPKRNVSIKTYDDTVGLSRTEERELKKALYASLQECKRLARYQLDTDEQPVPQVVPRQTRPIRSRSWPHTPSVCSTATPSTCVSVDESSQDSVKSSVSSVAEQKTRQERKIHAQRKFAQGSLPPTPSTTPVKVKASPIKLLPRRAKTEDFLTFLCLRGSSVLPPHLDFFNFSRGEPSHGEISAPETPPRPEPGSKCERTRESTPESSSVSTNDELYEIGTPSPCSVIANGRNGLSARKAARASASTPETARGIVSLSQGLTKKATRVSTPHRGRKSGLVDKTPSPRKGSPLVRGSPSKRGFAVKSLSPQFSKTPPKKKLSLKQKALLAFMPRKASTKPGSHREASSKQAVLEGSQTQVMYEQRSQHLQDIVEKLWWRSGYVTGQDLPPAVASDQKMPLLSAGQFQCPPSDQKIPFVSSHSFCPTSPVQQRGPARPQPQCSVVSERPECCESRAVEEVEAGQGRILAGSLLSPCEHTDGSTPVSKVTSQSDARNFDEDSEIGCNVGEMDDVISQTGGGGADADLHDGKRTADQVSPDVSQSECVVRIVHDQTRSESDEDGNVLILSKGHSPQTKDDLGCESQVNVLPWEVKPCIENPPGPSGLQGQCYYHPQCMKDQCSHQYLCKEDQCSVQPHFMEGQSSPAAIHSYKHALQAAKHNTFEEYLMNLPQECVISSGHAVSDTWRAGASCEEWTSGDAPMTLQQRGSNKANSSNAQGQWLPDSGITAHEKIPAIDTGEWLSEIGEIYFKHEDLQPVQVCPEPRQVNHVTSVEQGTFEEIYERDDWLPSCVDAFSGDLSPAKDYLHQDLLPSCVKSCHLEDLLWPDVAGRDDSRLPSQAELPYEHWDTVEVGPPHLEQGDQLLERASQAAELQQGIDPQLSGKHGHKPRSLQVLHNIHEEQQKSFFSRYSGELDTFENTSSFRNVHEMLNDSSIEHSESLFGEYPNMHWSNTERWSSHIRQCLGEHLSLLGRNGFYKQACQTWEPKLSQGAEFTTRLQEMLPCTTSGTISGGHDTVSGTISDDHDTANRKISGDHDTVSGTISGGHDTVSGRISECHDTVSGTISDDHDTASRRISGDHDTVSGTISGGHDTVSGTISDDHDTASRRISGDHDTVSGTISGDHDTVSGTISGCHYTASGRICSNISDGHNTVSRGMPDGHDTVSGRIFEHQQNTTVSHSFHTSTSSRLTNPLVEHGDCGSQDSSATDSSVLTEGQREMGYRVKRILVKPRQHSSENEIPPLEIRVIESLSPGAIEEKQNQCSSTQCATVSQVIGCTFSSVPVMTTGSHTEMSSESSKGNGRSAAAAVDADADADVKGGGLKSALASLAAQCEAMRTRKKRASALCKANSDVSVRTEYIARPVPSKTSRIRRNLGNNFGSWNQSKTFLKNECEKSPVKTVETTVDKSDENCHWKEQGHEQFGKQMATVSEVPSNTAATGIGLPSCMGPTHKRKKRHIHHRHISRGQGSKQRKKVKTLSRFSSRGVQLSSSVSRNHSSTMVENVSDLHSLQQRKRPQAMVRRKVCSADTSSVPKHLLMPNPSEGHVGNNVPYTQYHRLTSPREWLTSPREWLTSPKEWLTSPRESKSRKNETIPDCPVRASAEVVPLPPPPFRVQRCVEEAGRMAIKNNVGDANIVGKVQLSDQNTVYAASRLFPPPPCVMSCGICESSHNSFKPVDPVTLHRKSSAQSSKSLKERLKRKKELVEQKFRERGMKKTALLKGKLKVRSHVTKKDGRVDEAARKKSGRMEEHPRKKRMVRRSSVRLKELTKAMKAKNKRRRVIETEEEEVTITLPRPSRPVGRKRNFAPRLVGGSGVTDMPRFVREEEEFQVYTDDDDDDDEVSFGKLSSTGSRPLSVKEKKGKSSGRKKKVIGMRTRSSIQKVVSSPAKIVASKRLSAVKKLRKAKGDQMMLSKIIEKRRRLKQDDGKGEATKRGRKPTGSKKLGSPEKQSRSDSALKADLSTLMEVPTFRPTEEEFRDPIQYIESIREQAEPYGMCQVIPPSSWKCESKINEDMRFTAQVQLVHKLYKRWGPNIQFTASANKHLDAIGANLEPSPQIGGVEVDLYKLSHTIMEFGGMQNVVDKKKWVKIADAMKIPKLAQDRGMRLYDVYCKYLLPYDTLSMDEKTCLEQSVMSERQRKEKSGKGEDEEAIVKGKSNPLSTFNRVARNVRSMWFKDEPTPEQVECEYWRLVEGRSNHVAVQCGHVSTSTQGSGFPSKKDSPYARHSWNLNNLSENPKCILRCLGPVSGATIPTLHIGMLFATSCWCTDVHHLPYIQYLHTGADIVWYSIPKQQEGKLKTAMKELVPSLVSQDPHWLKEDTVMVNPSRLTARGVTVARCVQKPKTFVAIFSKSYTATISCGYNVSESVHYATRNWIRTGVSVAEDLSKSVEPELFSMDALLCHLVSDPTSDVQTLKMAVPFFEKVLMRELSLRKQLIETGLKVMKRGGMLDDMPAAPLSRKRSLDQVEDNVCDISKKHCYFSKVVNENENLTLSLEEGLKHVQKKKNLKHCKLVYRYPEEELKNMLHSAQCRLDISTNSDSTSTTSKKRGMKK